MSLIADGFCWYVIGVNSPKHDMAQMVQNSEKE